MKKLIWVVSLLLLLGTVGPSTAIAGEPLSGLASTMAEAPTAGGPFYSSVRIKGITSAVMTCTLYLYNNSGTLVGTASGISISGYEDKNVRLPVLPKGAYSGKLDCGGALVTATVEEWQPWVNKPGSSRAVYTAMSGASYANYIPLIYKNHYGWWSTFDIQNASPNVTWVNYTLHDANGTQYGPWGSYISPYASLTLDMKNFGVPDGIYSVDTTSWYNNAVVVNSYYQNGSLSDQWINHEAVPSTLVAYRTYLPWLYWDTQWVVGIAMYNPNSVTANVTITYYPGGSQNSYSIPPRGIATPVNSSPGAGYSAVVDSTVPLAVLVNHNNSTTRRAYTYLGLPSPSSLDTIGLPLIRKKFNHFTTATVCQNTGNVDAVVVVQYQGSGFETTTIAPNYSAIFSGTPLPNGYEGSATVTTSGADQKVFCFVGGDQYGDQTSIAADEGFYYNGAQGMYKSSILYLPRIDVTLSSNPVGATISSAQDSTQTQWLKDSKLHSGWSNDAGISWYVVSPNNATERYWDDPRVASLESNLIALSN